MAKVQISAKRKDDPSVTTVDYELGGTVDELVSQFGADVVATKARQSIVIDLQAYIRRQITPDKDGKSVSAKDLQANVGAWKPDNRVTTKLSAADKVKKALTEMTPEAKKALLASLKAEGVV